MPLQGDISKFYHEELNILNVKLYIKYAYSVKMKSRLRYTVVPLILYLLSVLWDLFDYFIGYTSTKTNCPCKYRAHTQ